MVKVRIISGFVADDVNTELSLDQLSQTECFMKTEGKKPGEVFEAMIALGIDWEIEYLSTTYEEEYKEWLLGDVSARRVRAEKMGKTIIFDGEPISYAEFDEKLIGFIREHGFLPDIIADNSASYILGIEDEEEEGILA